MIVTLTPDKLAVYEEAKQEGLVSSPLEWLDQLIDAWKEQQAQHELNTLLLEGEESGETDEDFNTIFAQLRSKHGL